MNPRELQRAKLLQAKAQGTPNQRNALIAQARNMIAAKRQAATASPKRTPPKLPTFRDFIPNKSVAPPTPKPTPQQKSQPFSLQQKDAIKMQAKKIAPAPKTKTSAAQIQAAAKSGLQYNPNQTGSVAATPEQIRQTQAENVANRAAANQRRVAKAASPAPLTPTQRQQVAMMAKRSSANSASPAPLTPTQGANAAVDRRQQVAMMKKKGK